MKSEQTSKDYDEWMGKKMKIKNVIIEKIKNQSTDTTK